MRQDCFDDVDGAEQVGVDLCGNLSIGEFFDGTEQAVAGVVDNDVDPSPVGERAVYDVVHGRGVGDVEDADPEQRAVALTQVPHGIGVSDGADDSVTALEQ